MPWDHPRAAETSPVDSMQSTQLCRVWEEYFAVGWNVVPVSTQRYDYPAEINPTWCISCQTCPKAFCEDCLPEGDLDAVGDVLPELYVDMLIYCARADGTPISFIACCLAMECERPPITFAVIVAMHIGQNIQKPGKRKWLRSSTK